MMEKKRRLINKDEQKARMRLAVDLCSLYGITIMLVHIIITILSAGSQERYPDYYIVTMINSVAATLLPALILAWLGNGIKYYVSSPFKKTKPLDSALLVVFGFCGCLTINMVTSFIDSLLPVMSRTVYITLDSNFGTFMLVLTATALFPAVCEEIGYRGYIYSSLSGYGHLFAVIVSSIIFGMMHAGIGSVIFALLCGFLFGCIRKTSGVFFLTIIIHFLNNAFSTLSTFVRMTFGRDAAAIFYGVSNNAAYILFIVIFLILRHRKVRVFRFKKAPGPLTWKDKLISVIGSPVFMMFIGLSMLFKFI